MIPRYANHEKRGRQCGATMPGIAMSVTTWHVRPEVPASRFCKFPNPGFSMPRGQVTNPTTEITLIINYITLLYCVS